MRAMVLLLFWCFTIACSQSESSIIPEDSANPEDLPIEQQLGTDEILFSLKIMSIPSDGKDICGTSKTNVSTVEVMEVMQYGSSVRRKVASEQQMDVVFLKKDSSLEAGMLIEAKARETLCTDTSSTYFTVIAHKILD